MSGEGCKLGLNDTDGTAVDGSTVGALEDGIPVGRAVGLRVGLSDMVGDLVGLTVGGDAACTR
jgi:hypothetical protein